MNSTTIKEQVSYVEKKWDLLWIVGGQCKEVVLRNQSYATSRWKKKQLENSTHKIGKLTPVETGTHNY